MLFTKKHIPSTTINLVVQGSKITFQNSFKILGVHFDNKMTWQTHIQHIISKCNKSLNVMRCVSSTTWGANKCILLTLYKSLILSQIDYCCFAYNDCSNYLLKKLDTVQYKSLLIVTGGMRGSALNALLSECGELPLQLRREKIIVKYLLKIKNNHLNAANEVLSNIKYFHLQNVNISIYNKFLKNFLSDNQITLVLIQLP